MQALRAAAALSVAFAHFAHDAAGLGADPAGWLAAATRAFPWDAGVDVFFVISGFVIVHAASPLFGQPGGVARFLRLRLTRIVPLYWLMTGGFLVTLLLDRATIHGDIGGPWYVLASFLFIPWPRPDGVMQPAFGLGWTLEYEMFFYLVMAPFLRLPRERAVPLAGLSLAGLVVLGATLHFHNPQLGYWSSPLLLEFCAGMALAQARAAGISLPFGLRILCVGLALAALHFWARAPAAWRPLDWGLPATLLVAAAALGRDTAGRRHRIALRLGAASYALYLFHPFVMRGLTLLWRHFHAAGLWRHFHAAGECAGLAYVVAGLALAQAGALLLHLGFEKKLLALLRGVGAPSPTGVAGTLS